MPSKNLYYNNNRNDDSNGSDNIVNKDDINNESNNTNNNSVAMILETVINRWIMNANIVHKRESHGVFTFRADTLTSIE